MKLLCKVPCKVNISGVILVSDVDRIPIVLGAEAIPLQCPQCSAGHSFISSEWRKR